jgi:hypothetical protein
VSSEDAEGKDDEGSGVDVELHFEGFFGETGSDFCLGMRYEVD